MYNFRKLFKDAHTLLSNAVDFCHFKIHREFPLIRRKLIAKVCDERKDTLIKNDALMHVLEFLYKSTEVQISVTNRLL